MEPEGIGPTLSFTEEGAVAHSEIGVAHCYRASLRHSKEQTLDWAVGFAI